MSDQMTDEQYSQTQSQIILLATAVNGLDLDGFLARISQAEALAPILDPTLYRRGAKPLGEIKRLAMALRPFQAEIRRQVEGLR